LRNSPRQGHATGRHEQLALLADYFTRGGTRKEIADLITRMDQEKSES
jgi:hypothetical protein